MPSRFFLFFLLIKLCFLPTAYTQSCDFEIQQTIPSCERAPIRFVPSLDRGFAYEWIFGDGDTSIQKSPIHVFTSNQSPYTIQLNIIDTLGNIFSCQKTISLTSAPGNIQATGNAVGCDDLLAPDSLFTSTFTISSGGGNFTWDWGDGSPSVTDNVLTHSYTYSRYGIFYLTITAEGEDCPSFIQKIRSHGQPLAKIGDPIGGKDNILCEDESICLWNESDANKSPIGWAIWIWEDRGGGEIISDTVGDLNPRCYTYSFEGNVRYANIQEVKLQVFNECYTEETPEYRHQVTTEIIIFAKPRARFDAPGVVCIVDSTICFANNSFPNSTNRPNTYQWDFGDPASGLNNTSTEVSPCYTYSQAGSYTVKMIVKNGCGTDTMRKEITILPQPVAEAVASDTVGCMPMLVSFTNNSIPPPNAGQAVRYDWKVTPETGRVQIDSFANDPFFFEPNIIFYDSGRYKVELIVITACDSVIWCDSIIVGRPPSIEIAEILDTCDQVSLVPEAVVDSFGVPITRYQWTFMNGIPTTYNELEIQGTITFGVGTHTISLEAENECGIARDSETFTVADLESVEAGSDFTFCVNIPPFVLGGLPEGGRWEGEGVDEQNVFTPPGIGTYKLYYKIGRGRCEVTDSMDITLIGAPSVEVLTPDTAVCLGNQPISLRTNQGGGSWNQPLAAGDLFIPDSLGVITFVYTFTSGQTGCSASDSVSITVNPLPELCVRDTSFCFVNENLALASCPTTAGLGSWAGPGITNALDGTFNPALAGEGIHSLVYTFTTDLGCSAEDSIQVSVVSPNTMDAGSAIDACINTPQVFLTDFQPVGGRWNVGGDFLSADTFAVATSALLPFNNGFLVYTIGSGTCQVSDSIAVSIRDTLAVEAGDDRILCEDGLPVNLVSQVNPGGGIFSGQGIVNSNTGAFDPRLVPAGVSYLVLYEINNPNGCVSREVIEVLVDSLPVADFQLPQDSCINEPIPFINLSSNTNSCQWDFGDLTNAQNCSPTHAYTSTGSFEVRLIAISANQCRDSLTKSITIYEVPIASFSKDVDSLCADGNGVVPVNITDMSNPAGGSYFWDFGNGDTSMSPNPGTVFFAQDTCPVTYYISLSIVNECGTHSMIDSVKVFPRPQVNWGTQVNTGCSPLLIEFNNVSLGKPETFEWLIDGVPFSTDSIPEDRYFFAAERDSVYRILLVSENRCGTDSLAHILTVKPNTINPFFNTDPVEGCAPLDVQFTDYSGAPYISWDFGDNTRSSLNNPLHTFEDAGTYLVQMFADNGCSFDTGTVEIEVFPNRAAEFVQPEAICLGEAMAFEPLSTDRITAYIWDFGDGDSSMEISPEHLYASAGTYRVRLTSIADAMGCPNSWETDVLVRALPEVYFRLSDTSGCQALSVRMDSVPVGLGLFYDWSLGDSNSSTLASLTHIYQTSGDYELSLTVTDDFGCQRDSSASIRVHPLPLSAFSTDRLAYCGRDSVYFQNASQAAMGWVWDFGDGTNSSLRNPVKVFEEPGLYEVGLISINTFDCRDSVFQSVEILPQAQANLLADSLQGCFPFEVSLTNSSLNYSRSNWDFGDGVGSNMQQPDPHTYFGADQSYTIILVVDTAGFCPDTASLQIDVGSWPISQFQLSADEGCEQEEVSFVNLSQSDSLELSFDWRRNGQPFSNQAIPADMPLTTGEYEILLIATNTFGCRDSSSQTIRIYPQPLAQIALSDTSGCVPMEVRFENLSTNFSHARWELEPGLFNESFNPIHTYFISDDSILIQLVVDTADFCFDTITQMVTVASFPQSEFEASDYVGCSELTATLVSQASSNWRPININWDLDGANPPFSTDSIFTANFSATGATREYMVRHIVVNDFGCADTSARIFSVYPQPTALFQVVPETGCSPLKVQFENLSEDFTDVLWDFGDGFFDANIQAQHTYLAAGDYDVGLVVNYEGRCFDSLRIDQLIHVAQSPIADFSYMDSIPPSGNAKGYVVFTNMSMFADTYRWNFGDGSGESRETNPIHQYKINDEYSARLIAYASNGCTDTATQKLVPTNFGNLHIPNAFAPKAGSSSRDLFTVFKPIGIGLEKFEIAVYTTWGKRVWYSTKLNELGHPVESWDGAGFTEIANPEVFIWKVHEATFKGGYNWQGPREGTLTIIR